MKKDEERAGPQAVFSSTFSLEVIARLGPGPILDFAVHFVAMAVGGGLLGSAGTYVKVTAVKSV